MTIQKLCLNLFIFSCLFTFDLFLLHWWGIYTIPVMAIIALTTLLQERYFIFSTALLLIGFETMLLTDLFGLYFLYLIPLFLSLLYLKRYSHFNYITALIGLLFLMTSHQLFLWINKLNATFFGHYTINQFIVSLITIVISLKWLSTGEQGNRLRS